MIAVTTSAGTSGFDLLIEGPEFNGSVPYPFSTFAARLETSLGPDALSHAIIPFGRSLHRYSADPDYLGSPRIVVSVTGNEGSGALQNRLFFGFQPASSEIEVISFDSTNGVFQFQRVIGYANGETPEIVLAERDVCTTCHQNQAPIFASPLWAETNANPAISKLLEPLGPQYHGFSTGQNVDQVAKFDASVVAANQLLNSGKLWRGICRSAVACKTILEASLRRAVFGPSAVMDGMSDDTLTPVFPDDTANTDFRIANFDPVAAMAQGLKGSAIIDRADESFGADKPRSMRFYWRNSNHEPEVLQVLANVLSAALNPALINQIRDGLALCSETGFQHEIPGLQTTANGLFTCAKRQCAGVENQHKIKLRHVIVDEARMANLTLERDTDNHFTTTSPGYSQNGYALRGVTMLQGRLRLELVDHSLPLSSAVAALPLIDNSSPALDHLLSSISENIAAICLKGEENALATD